MITVSKDKLLSALTCVSIPKVSKVLCTYKDAKLLFTTAGSETQTIRRASVDVEGEIVDFYIDYNSLLTFINLAKPKNNITMSVGKGIIEISTGDSTVTLPLLPIQDAVTIEEEDMDICLLFFKEDLLTAIDKTKDLMYANGTRYNINGLHFNCQASLGLIDVVSTNGHCLAKFVIEDNTLKQDIAFTIPYNTVSMVREIIKNEQENSIEMRLNPSKTKMKVCTGSSAIISSLIDSEFVPYHRAVQLSLPNKCIVESVSDFQNALSIVTAVNQGAVSNSVQCILKGDEFIINSYGNMISKAHSALKGNGVGSIYADCGYLLSIMKLITSKNVKIETNERETPIKISDTEDSRFFYIVMPLKNA